MDTQAKPKSKALEVNLADYHVDVEVDPRYGVLQEVMSRYFGLMDGLNTFLRELSHPYMNCRFVVAEARKYSLDYFHVFREHPRGPEAARVMLDILHHAVCAAKTEEIQSDGIDGFLLYVQKIITDAGDEFDRFRGVVLEAFEQLRGLPAGVFQWLVRSYYPVKRVAAEFIERNPAECEDFEAINRLLAAALEQTYRYWLSERDPAEWFGREAAEECLPGCEEPLFQAVSHDRIGLWRQALAEIQRELPPGSRAAAEKLVRLPDFRHFTEAYRALPQALMQSGGEGGRGHHLKLIMLFHIMSISGLAFIHEETLREINQTLTWIIVNENYRNIEKLIRKTFAILKQQSHAYPATALNCALNMGKGVHATDDIDLVNFFIDRLIDFGFQAPMVKGIDDQWQIQVNPAHVLNIRTWLKLIKLNPKRSIRLLSALVIHLSLSGVLIRDIDLFPRDVTALLNAPIGPVYNLVKQLCRLLPVFYNDIGAEGRLRDVSTRLDELSQRRDLLVHFLRKQSHVESSNQIIGFAEAVFQFWKTRDKSLLEKHLPPAIFEKIDSRGPHVDGLHRIMQGFVRKGLRIPDDFLAPAPDGLRSLLGYIPGASDTDMERAALAIEFYKLLCQKYNFSFVDVEHYLSQIRPEGLPELGRFEQALAEETPRRRLELLLDYLEILKKTITAETVYEIREDIYQKRHITIDIPSMYGSYHEMKFDCLGLSLRVEALVNVLFENRVHDIDLGLITKATFFQVFDLLKLFGRALRLDGMASAEFERQLEFLGDSLVIRGFTLTQYVDIFKGFVQAVRNVINDCFHNVHGANLNRVLAQLPVEALQPKYLPPEPVDDRERLQHRASEIFFRDQIAACLGLQQLDLFLGRILSTLFQQAERLPKENMHQLLLYDPHFAMVDIDRLPRPAPGVILLGSKGVNLVRLSALGFRVPPGFIITTEVFRCRQVIENYPPAQRHFTDQINQHLARLEGVSGKKFGDPTNPLLISVRSGSSISQPGMMDTLLNVGNNPEITAGMAARSENPWFAWDNYRRFLQSYGMLHELTRDDFDAVIAEHKRRLGLPLKRLFSGEQMRQVALDYKRMILDAGIEIVDAPHDQLYLAIRTVIASWESPKAQAYRRIMGISDDWGTAVAIQAMVYGNLSPQSGTGVIFTHNPRWSGEVLRLWGDFTTANQGEDVVSGLVRTMPISVFQQDIELRDTDVTLETHFPEIYRALKASARMLIDEHGWSPQEIEFTFESPQAGDLYLLQTRDMAMRESKTVLKFDFEGRPRDRLLGHGIGVSGGAMSGRLVFSLEEIAAWRLREPESRLILARADTVPDDIREIHAADGLLTERGGLTSHAAVVAHRLGKTCVVGCGDMVCHEKEKRCVFRSAVLHSGDLVSIDGHEGSVYRGAVPVAEP
ncbi:MAG: PEP/pyruvate-binding domain-containing protein [Desulfobacterales bacterium]